MKRFILIVLVLAVACAAASAQDGGGDANAVWTAASLPDPAKAAEGLRRFLAAKPASEMAPVARERLVDALVRAKAPAGEIVAAADALVAVEDAYLRARGLPLAAMALAERREQLDRALGYARKAVASASKKGMHDDLSVQAGHALGWVHFIRGETKEAIDALEAVAPFGRDDQSLWLHLGLAYEKDGRADAAIDAYTRSLAVFTGDDTSAEGPLRRLYEKRHGSQSGLEAKVAAERDTSRRYLALEAKRFEKTAPEWQLSDLAGNPVRMSDFKGRPVVMTFWGTWCPPCRAELPHFQALHGKYGPRGVAFIAMNWEPSGAPEDRLRAAREYVAKQGFTFPVVVDHERAVAHAFGASFPTLFVIDRSGTIRFRNVGYKAGVERLVEVQIEAILEPGPAATTRAQ